MEPGTASSGNSLRGSCPNSWDWICSSRSPRYKNTGLDRGGLFAVDPPLIGGENAMSARAVSAINAELAVRDSWVPMIIIAMGQGHVF
jgi:hypothetical protein